MKHSLIDSSVVFTATGQIGEAWAVVILEEAAKGNISAAADALHVLEIHDRHQRAEPYAGKLMARAYRQIVDEILPVTDADFIASAELAACHAGVSPRDLLHAAVALNNGIKEIFSVDGPLFGDIKGLETVDLPGLRARFQLKERYQNDRTCI